MLHGGARTTSPPTPSAKMIKPVLNNVRAPPPPPRRRAIVFLFFTFALRTRKTSRGPLAIIAHVGAAPTRTAPKRPTARRTTAISFAQTTRDAPVLVNTRAYAAPKRGGFPRVPTKFPRGNGLLVIVLLCAKRSCTGTHPWPKNTKSDTSRPSNLASGLVCSFRFADDS